MKLFFTKKKVTDAAPKRVYLDNAGATPIGARPMDALVSALSVYGNPSGIHHEGARAGQLLDKARAMCATALNAHAYEIYFMSSGTESCNLAVLGVYSAFSTKYSLKSTVSSLPHIITSSIEHPAVLEPIKKLEREKKIRVTYLPVYDDGIVKVKDLRDALCEETILVSVMYANNEIGTIQPVKEIGRAIDEWKRENGKTFTSYPYFHTDACQAANYCNLDVLRLKCHLMTVNSSKVYGPKGSALLYKREGIMIAPVTYGGGQERELRSGTEAVPLHYSFGSALQEAVEMREVESTRLRALRDETVELLRKEIPSIIFYGAFEGKSKEQRVTNKEVSKTTNPPHSSLLTLPSDFQTTSTAVSQEYQVKK